jgi:aspartyl-tRNA(Asn)/glutamyl-tRNA(Gln) amidotransferase subunit B
MSDTLHPYEAVIGLEVHAQLSTRSKLFCGDETRFGADPNTQVSAISLAHPGTLPMMNRAAVEHAIRLGLVCHSQIRLDNHFARKNYFYPDLPKGYQISQHTTPICEGGWIDIHVDDQPRRIRLTRIHLEEDAGKSLHDQDTSLTCLDFNRAGTPLVEIVTEPDIRSAAEAFAFLTEIRRLVRWIGVCDGNMEEGSLRCDANVSIRKKGDTRLGTRVEVKNLNSVRHVRKAIDYEISRLAEMDRRGETIRQETRSFDADTETTFSIRVKEDADDYRYFPDPDLAPFSFSDAYVESVRASLPALPEILAAEWIERLGLQTQDARVLTHERELADYFNDSLGGGAPAKMLANFIIGPMRSWMHEHATSWSAPLPTPVDWKALTDMVDEGVISFSAAAARLLPAMLAKPGVSPGALAASLNLVQDAGQDQIRQWVAEVLAAMPDKVKEYQKGKKGLIGLFMGEVKRVSRGKADPRKTNDALIEALQKNS